MRSSTVSTARSARSFAAALAAALAAPSVAWGQPSPPVAEAVSSPPAAEAVPTPRAVKTDGKSLYSCNAEPWAGNEERFVSEMLLKWREDYRKLSVGELRIYIRDVMLGLQPPGERYGIETGKRGSILFERKDGDIRCTIRQP